MLNLLSPMMLKIKIALAIVVVVIIAGSVLQINSLRAKNAALETRLVSLTSTIQMYTEAMEAQAKQNSEDLTRYKFDRELQNDINKVKGTSKDTAIDPELVRVINKLQQSREQTNRSDTR